MDAYRFSLYLGFTGMVSMAALSFLGQIGHSHSSHGGHTHGGHHGNGGHHGDTHGHAAHHVSHHNASHHHGHEHGGHHHQHHHSHERNLHASDWMMLLLSPRVWFSVLLGFGAAGIILKGILPLEPWRFLLACCGGIGFEKFLVAPLWNFWFRFAGEGHTLESAVAEEARAVTNFDAGGHGLISLNLDGQIVQLLGRLSERARADGVRVRAGDVLMVEAVDTQRQSCTVSPMKQI